MTMLVPPVLAPAVLLPPAPSLVSSSPSAPANKPSAPLAAMGMPGITSGVNQVAGAVLSAVVAPTPVALAVPASLSTGVLPPSLAALSVVQPPRSAPHHPPPLAALAPGYSPPISALAVGRIDSQLAPGPALLIGTNLPAAGSTLAVKIAPVSDVMARPTGPTIQMGTNIPTAGSDMVVVQAPVSEFLLPPLPPPVALLSGYRAPPVGGFSMIIALPKSVPIATTLSIYAGAPLPGVILQIARLDPYQFQSAAVGPHGTLGQATPPAAIIQSDSALPAPTWATATIAIGAPALAVSGGILTAVGPFNVPPAQFPAFRVGVLPPSASAMVVGRPPVVPEAPRGSFSVGAMPPSGFVLYALPPISAVPTPLASLAAGILPPIGRAMAIAPTQSSPPSGYANLVPPPAPTAVIVSAVEARAVIQAPALPIILGGVVPSASAKPLMVPVAVLASLPQAPIYLTGYSAIAAAGRIQYAPMVTTPQSLPPSVTIYLPGFGSVVVYLTMPSTPILWPILTASEPS